MTSLKDNIQNWTLLLVNKKQVDNLRGIYPVFIS